MNLQLIRELCNRRNGGIKQLAEDADMSEANLHRCIRNNKIQASDLEKLALLLNVSVGVFFGEVSVADDRISLRIKHLEELVTEKERLIQILMEDRK